MNSGRRSLGQWSLLAVGLNLVVGSGFFLLPSRTFAHVGAWAPILIVVVGATMIPIALFFAEAGSRFAESGGPYTFVRAAFGRLPAFQIALLLWISRVVAQAAVLSGVVMLLPELLGRALPPTVNSVVVLLITGVVTAFSVAGGRQNMRFINALIVLKLAPIVGLVMIALWHMEGSLLRLPAVPSITDFSAAALLVLYSFAGFELLTIPAGEASNPQRDTPRALAGALGAAAVIMTLSHLVVIGITPEPAALRVALADVAFALFGSSGRIVLLLTAIVAIVGHNAGSLLSASRLLFAVAAAGDAPRNLARLNERYETPSAAIIVTAVCVVILTLSRTFEWLVILTVATRLLVYSGVVAATLQLRRKEERGEIPQAHYHVPYARSLAAVALLMCVGLLGSMGAEHVLVVGGTLLVGTSCFILAKRAKREAGAVER